MKKIITLFALFSAIILTGNSYAGIGEPEKIAYKFGQFSF